MPGAADLLVTRGGGGTPSHVFRRLGPRRLVPLQPRTNRVLGLWWRKHEVLIHSGLCHLFTQRRKSRREKEKKGRETNRKKNNEPRIRFFLIEESITFNRWQVKACPFNARRQIQQQPIRLPAPVPNENQVPSNEMIIDSWLFILRDDSVLIYSFFFFILLFHSSFFSFSGSFVVNSYFQSTFD